MELKMPSPLVKTLTTSSHHASQSRLSTIWQLSKRIFGGVKLNHHQQSNTATHSTQVVVTGTVRPSHLRTPSEANTMGNLNRISVFDMVPDRTSTGSSLRVTNFADERYSPTVSTKSSRAQLTAMSSRFFEHGLSHMPYIPDSPIMHNSRLSSPRSVVVNGEAVNRAATPLSLLLSAASSQSSLSETSPDCHATVPHLSFGTSTADSVISEWQTRILPRIELDAAADDATNATLERSILDLLIMPTTPPMPATPTIDGILSEAGYTCGEYVHFIKPEGPHPHESSFSSLRSSIRRLRSGKAREHGAGRQVAQSTVPRIYERGAMHDRDGERPPTPPPKNPRRFHQTASLRETVSQRVERKPVTNQDDNVLYISGTGRIAEPSPFPQHIGGSAPRPALTRQSLHAHERKEMLGRSVCASEGVDRVDYENKKKLGKSGRKGKFRDAGKHLGNLILRKQGK